MNISRRAYLQTTAGVLAASTLEHALSAPPSPTTGMGLVTYCCRIRQRWLREQGKDPSLSTPAQFLDHCVAVGAGGMQTGLGSLGADDVRALRAEVERTGRFLEAIIRLPQSQGQVDDFRADMRRAREAGALAVRTTMIPGRRYEYFDSLEQFREVESRGRQALERAAPIAEQLELPLAVENHKDHRNDERVALFEAISSEFVGACLDTGNSVALLEDALDTARALAPWTHSVHLKDQAVQLYPDGFLLADIPLGKGFLPLKPIVDLVRQQRPHVRFSLELITRDPLRVPCLTEKFWATFPELPGRVLARMLGQVREGAASELPQVSSLSLQQQVAREDANVRESLAYARDVLKI